MDPETEGALEGGGDEPTQPNPPASAAGAADAGQPAGSASPEGGKPAAPSGGDKLLTQAQVNEIVQQRLADERKKYEPYKKFGTPDQLSAKLAALNQYTTKYGDLSKPQVNPQTEAVRQELLKHVPELGRLGEIDQFRQELAEREAAKYQAQVKTGQSKVAALAKDKLGLEDAGQVGMIENLVASVLFSGTERDEEGNVIPGPLFSRWQSGDLSAVDEAFSQVESLVKSLEKRFAANYAKGKRGTLDLTRTPSGTGTPVAIHAKAKLTDKELSQRAFAALQERAKAEA